MKLIKAVTALAVSMLTFFVLVINVSAADVPAGEAAYPPPESVKGVEIFTGGYVFTINFNDLSLSSDHPASANLLNRVESVEIAKLEKGQGNYFMVADLVSFKGNGRLPFPEDFSAGDETRALFYEPAAQIRGKLTELEWSERMPRDIDSSHIRMNVLDSASGGSGFYDSAYHDVTLGGFHFYRDIYSETLTREEADWFTGKVLETIGLPKGYDRDLLFSGNGEFPKPLSANSKVSEESSVALNEPDYFYYNFLNGGKENQGSYSIYSSGSFLVWTENGKTYLEASANNERGGKLVNVFTETDASVFDELSKIIRENQTSSWDKTYSYTESENVKYFSLESVHGNEITQAYMYGAMPANYPLFHDDIFNFFAEYTENAEVYVPPLESLGHIFVVADGFQININGTYGEDSIYIDNIDVNADIYGRGANYYSYPYNLRDYLVEKNNYYNFDFNEEAYGEFLDKLLSLKFISPDEFYSDDDYNGGFISVNYTTPSNKADHSIYTKLSPEEEKWFTNKLAETVRLTKGNGFYEIFPEE